MSLPLCRSVLASILSIGAITFAVFSNAAAQETPPAKGLTGYRYRVPVTVENRSGAEIPPSPVLLRFDTMMQIMREKLRPDGADLRVADANGNEMPRVIEGLQDDTEPARIWFRSTPLAAGARQSYFLYYGNPATAVRQDEYSNVFSRQAEKNRDAIVQLDFENFSPDIKPVPQTELIQPRGVPGYHGKGAWFNGQNAGMSLKLENAAALQNGLTIAFWAKLLPHKPITFQMLAAVDGLQILENEVRLATDIGMVSVPYQLPYQEWHHVAVSVDAQNLRVFVDGKEAGSKPLPGSYKFPRGNVSLGFEDVEGGRFFVPFVMDDFIIVPRAMTSFPSVATQPAITLGTEEINSDVPVPADKPNPYVYMPVEAESFEGLVREGKPEMSRLMKDRDKKLWYLSGNREYLSRDYGIVTLAEGATTSKNIEVPRDGNYHIWVRYAPIGEQEALRTRAIGSGFQLKVEQKRAAAASHQFGESIEYDSRQARWESFGAPLKKGPATLTLTKNVPNPRAGEKIDFLVLTDDPNYVPDYRYFSMVYLRWKLLEAKGNAPYQANLALLFHEVPWYKRTTLRNGEYFLQPGSDTGWFDTSEYSANTVDFTVTLNLIEKNSDKRIRKSPQWAKVQLDYSRLPQDSAIFKSVVSESTRDFGYSVLGAEGDFERSDEWSDTVEAISRGHLAQARAQNWPKDNTPKVLTVSATSSIEQYSDEVIRNELTTLRLMGFNHLSSGYSGFGGRAQTDIAKELGIDRTLLVFYLNGAGRGVRRKESAFSEKFWAAIEEDFHKRIQDMRDRSGEDEIKLIRWVQLNDEVAAYLWPKELLAQPESLAAFKKWLEEQKVTPAFLGLASFNELKPLDSRKDAKTPEQKRLWALQMDFNTYHTTMVYKRATQMVEKAVGHPVETAINPSPHWYLINGYADDDTGMNFLKFWQDGGVVMPWSEDWCYDNGLLYISAEQASYVAALNLCGTAQSRPTGMYITTGSSMTRRMKMDIALGRGAKHVNHYTYGPRFANTEASWSHRPENFNNVGFINAEIARADDLLGPAKPRRGQVALLYPFTTDVWKHSGASNAERMYEYFALAHGQMPVDILSEEQVANGALVDYKVLYVVGDNVRKPAVQQIAKWLNGGGTLVAMAGAGSRDEYDAPSNSFDALLGLNSRTAQWIDGDPNMNFHRNGIPRLQSVGEIRFNGTLGTGTLPVYSHKATADVKRASVIGTWGDGSPAATINQSGQGRGIFIGAYPGLSYARGSNMGEGITTDYPAAVRDILLAPAKLAGVKRDVELSTPVVEAVVQDGAQGSVVTLVNYTMKPIDEVTMTVSTLKPIKRVVSVQTGKELKYLSTKTGITIKMPLGMTDFVKLYY